MDSRLFSGPGQSDSAQPLPCTHAQVTGTAAPHRHNKVVGMDNYNHTGIVVALYRHADNTLGMMSTAT